MAEVEKLPEDERIILAEHRASLSPVLHDLDDGDAEAERRDAEMDANPSLGISLEALDPKIASRRS